MFIVIFIYIFFNQLCFFLIEYTYFLIDQYNSAIHRIVLENISKNNQYILNNVTSLLAHTPEHPIFIYASSYAIPAIYASLYQ